MVQMGGAVDMLCHQLGTILDYLQVTGNPPSDFRHLRALLISDHLLHPWPQRVHAREAPMDHAVVRAVSAISQQLPDPNSPVFREALAEQTSSALAPVYLAVLTKGADQLYELMRKVSVAHGRSARGTPRGRALE